jgi:MFS-type transporter involved in bile tolerance (Atg22 family)
MTATMDGKTRLILVLLMTSVMVLMVTLLATYLNLGFRPDFVIQWMKAYFIAWPVAALTGFLVMPTAHRLTDRIVHLIDGQR